MNAHWGRVTHICVGKLTIIGILLIRTLRTNFSEILIVIHTFSFTKMHLKPSSAKWRPFCFGINVLIRSTWHDIMKVVVVVIAGYCLIHWRIYVALGVAGGGGGGEAVMWYMRSVDIVHLAPNSLSSQHFCWWPGAYSFHSRSIYYYSYLTKLQALHPKTFKWIGCYILVKVSIPTQSSTNGCHFTFRNG